MKSRIRCFTLKKENKRQRPTGSVCSTVISEIHRMPYPADISVTSTIIMVLEFPPRESLIQCKCVNLLSRYGT